VNNLEIPHVEIVSSTRWSTAYFSGARVVLRCPPIDPEAYNDINIKGGPIASISPNGDDTEILLIDGDVPNPNWQDDLVEAVQRYLIGNPS
jgi:hypothetical protein